jgi:hypothetical protein
MANWGGVAPRDEEGMTPVDHSHRFAEFMRGHARRLREMDARKAADEIGDLVVSLDKRLGVELSEDNASGEREVIITAFSIQPHSIWSRGSWRGFATRTGTLRCRPRR